MQKVIRIRSFSPLQPKGIGFTLIELLTVVAVIGVLSSILLGALGRAKRNSKSTLCINQMRQLGLAVSTYMVENLYFPSCRAVLGPTESYEGWESILAPAFGGAEVMRDKYTRCSLGRDNPGDYSEGKTHYQWNYVGSNQENPYNLGLGRPAYDIANSKWYVWGVTESMVRMPSEMVVINESDVPSLWTGTAQYAVPVVPTKRHGGRGNFLFVDGHVQGLRPEQVTNPVDLATLRWNNDHELHPTTE